MLTTNKRISAIFMGIHAEAKTPPGQKKVTSVGFITSVDNPEAKPHASF
jgi:hypothetical protein